MAPLSSRAALCIAADEWQTGTLSQPNVQIVSAVEY